MRLLEKAGDGGESSGVTGYYLIEMKKLFTIVLLHFEPGSREAYHNHAFNALTIWLTGKVIEHKLDGRKFHWKAGDIKYTPRENFHKVQSLGSSWALCFRGPWVDKWNEFRDWKYVTLTHGRIEVE